MTKNRKVLKSLFGLVVTLVVASIIFYSGTKALPFIVAMAFVLGMSGMLYFRTFDAHDTYYALSLGVACSSGLIMLVGVGHTAMVFL